MNLAARTVFFFGVYLLGLGAILIFIPNVLLNIFGIAATNEVWIRVVGMLAWLLAFYYFRTSLRDTRTFFQDSVYVRSSVIVFFIVFVLAGWAPPALILFGVIDLLGAIWTAWALRR